MLLAEDNVLVTVTLVLGQGGLFMITHYDAEPVGAVAKHRNVRKDSGDMPKVLGMATVRFYRMTPRMTMPVIRCRGGIVRQRLRCVVSRKVLHEV